MLPLVPLAIAGIAAALLASKEECFTKGYRPRIEGRGTSHHWRNLSPSLRGCYADPIELALEEHEEKLPAVIKGTFRTSHHYVNPKDPPAWPKRCAVTTVCLEGKLRSFVHKPNEDLSVFDTL